jgi:hypothetical protein
MGTNEDILKKYCDERDCTLEDLVLQTHKSQEQIIEQMEQIQEKQKIGKDAIADLRVVEVVIKGVEEGLKTSQENQNEIKEMIKSVKIDARQCVREPDFIKLGSQQKLILTEIKAMRNDQAQDRGNIKEEKDRGTVRNGKTDHLEKDFATMKSDLAFLRGKAEGQVESQSNSWKQWQLLVGVCAMIISFIAVLFTVMKG